MELNNYIENKINKLSYSIELQSYLIQILKKPSIDLHNTIIILEYAKAYNNYNFNKFQQIGDWILFSQSIYPNSLNGGTFEYFTSIGQISYFQCYKILKKQWKIYEELSDLLPDIIIDLNKAWYY